MSRIAIPLVAALLSAALLLPPEAADAAPRSGARTLCRFAAIGTGPVAGTYFTLGVALASMLNETDPAEAHFVVPTEGSLENLALLARGDLAFAFCQSDLVTWAAAGDRMFTGAPMRGLRVLAALHPEEVQVVVRADSGLRTLEDLRGARIGAGAARSGTRIHAEAVLQAAGIARAEVRLDDSEFLPALEKLGERTLDAVFLTAGIPTAAVAEFAARTPVRLLPIPKARLAAIRATEPYFTAAVIPAGTYPGQTAEVETLATRAMLVTTDALPPAAAARVVAALADGVRRFAAAHPSVARFRAEDLGKGIPHELVHPAVRERFGR